MKKEIIGNVLHQLKILLNEPNYYYTQAVQMDEYFKFDISLERFAFRTLNFL
jgi:hypothetical protein